MRPSIPTLLRVVLAAAALAWIGPAAAQDAQALYARTLAASCGHCHGSDGRAVADDAMPRLAGRPAQDLRAALRAFRAGERAGTVMPQLSRGYTPEQLDELARWFAAQR